MSSPSTKVEYNTMKQGVANDTDPDSSYVKAANYSESGNQNHKERTYNMCFLAQLVTIIGIGGFLFGYDCGVIAGA